MQSPLPCVSWRFNRLPSWKRNTPPPACSKRYISVVPAHVADGDGEFEIARRLRRVNEPSVPVPAKLSSSIVVLGCCRLLALLPEVPENVIFTPTESCAQTAATPRVSTAAIGRKMVGL